MASAPPEDGYFLTAPWERHAWCYLAWPRDPGLFEELAQLHRLLAETETVFSLRSAGQNGRTLPALLRDQRVRGPDIPTDTARIRDFGPAFVVDGRGAVAGVHFRHTGWGGRQLNASNDARFAHALCGEAEVRRFPAPLALEHGAYSCDGRGTLIVLSSAVLEQGRNPGLDKATAFASLHQWLGAERVLWLGVDPDPADVTAADLHRLARFIAPACVVISGHDRPKAARITAALAGRKDAGGRAIRIIELPAPDVDGIPGASYTSFVFANAAVLLPAYGGAQDEVARDILADALPTHDIRITPATELTRVGLTLDALVLFQPARVWRSDKVDKLPKSARMPSGTTPEEMMVAYVNKLGGGAAGGSSEDGG